MWHSAAGLAILRTCFQAAAGRQMKARLRGGTCAVINSQCKRPKPVTLIEGNVDVPGVLGARPTTCCLSIVLTTLERKPTPSTPVDFSENRSSDRDKEKVKRTDGHRCARSLPGDGTREHDVQGRVSTELHGNSAILPTPQHFVMKMVFLKRDQIKKFLQ